MNNIKIYSLSDPITKELRYIGKTIQKLNTRLKRHLNDSNKKNNHRACWIKSLKNKNLKPEIELIEECNEDNWIETEQFYIAYFKSLGFRLVNSTDGGEGLHGIIQSDDWRRKNSESNKNIKKSQEHRSNISLSKKGDLNPAKKEEVRKKISETLKNKWKEKNEEEKQSQIKGFFNEESREKAIKIKIENYKNLPNEEKERRRQICIENNKNKERDEKGRWKKNTGN